MQKRGMLLLEVLVKLVPVIIILLLFLGFVFVFLPSFFGENRQQDKNSFQSSGKIIETMLSKNTKYESYELELTLPSVNIIKGFSSGDLKPGECGTDPCICMYYKTESIAENKPDTCYAFKATDFYETVDFYTTPDASRGYTDQMKTTFGLSKTAKPNPPYPAPLDSWDYSELYFHTESANNRPQVNTVYFEKYVQDNRAYILMAKVVDGTLVQVGKGITREQMRIRAENLKPCPVTSDTDCIGQSINSKSDNGLCKYDGSTCKLLEVEECTLDAPATEDCICGSNLMNKGDSSSPAVCTKDREGNYKALGFSCTAVTDCRSYCDTTKTNGVCYERSEQNICAIDPCKVGPCGNVQNICISVKLP
jgi:hypothetical protein